LPSDENTDPEFYVFQCWCWIPRQYSLISLIVYIIYWIFIISNFLMIWKTISFLKKLMKRTSSADMTTNTNLQIKQLLVDTQNNNNLKIQKMIKKLYVYPIVAILIWSVASSSRLYEYFYYQIPGDERTDFDKYLRLALYSLHAIVMSLRGFFYTLVYFMRYEKINKEVKATWKKFCDFLCCVPGRKDTYLSSDESVNTGR
jgi:hypothetical protein